MKGIIKATGEEADFQRITIIADPVFESDLPPLTVATYYTAEINGIGAIFNEEQVTIIEE